LTQLLEENRGKLTSPWRSNFWPTTWIRYGEERSERNARFAATWKIRRAAWAPGNSVCTAGAVQNKVTDALSPKMSFTAAAGHAAQGFSRAKHLAAHPEFSWQKAGTSRLKAYPWTTSQPNNCDLAKSARFDSVFGVPDRKIFCTCVLNLLFLVFQLFDLVRDGSRLKRWFMWIAVSEELSPLKCWSSASFLVGVVQLCLQFA